MLFYALAIVLFSYGVFWREYLNGDFKIFYIRESLSEPYGKHYNPKRMVLGIPPLVLASR